MSDSDYWPRLEHYYMLYARREDFDPDNKLIVQDEKGPEVSIHHDEATGCGLVDYEGKQVRCTMLFLTHQAATRHAEACEALKDFGPLQVTPKEVMIRCGLHTYEKKHGNPHAPTHVALCLTPGNFDYFDNTGKVSILVGTFKEFAAEMGQVWFEGDGVIRDGMFRTQLSKEDMKLDNVRKFQERAEATAQVLEDPDELLVNKDVTPYHKITFR